MAKAFALVGAVAVALTSSTAATTTVRSQRELRASPVRKIRVLSLELVGQFQNSAPGVSPATHVHYGYLSYIRGLSVFRAVPNSETTALLTFSADAATLRVIANGPLRIVTRVGKLRIYRDPATNGDFGKPDTFRDGTPVLVADFRQEVVNDTVTNTFTTFHQNTITATRPFTSGGRRVQLGQVGEKFTTVFSGHGNMPGPPSGYFGGYAISG
jgi:hypothetical protein